MTIPATRNRAHRAIRKIYSFAKELLGELTGELVLTAAACCTVAGLALAFLWGWSHNPLFTGGTAAGLLLFLAYGAWELLRPAKPGRRGRLAGAAAATCAVAVTFLVYSISCNCS
ncbi:hypothetical protein AB0O07_31085 [Streptomyces sp. NPDC093085]|uniref:hypothetical protein n=1 Tax=Streptomyces sp. NPDC093085 TaxID=3155068 RepID=UPI00344868D9